MADTAPNAETEITEVADLLDDAGIRLINKTYWLWVLLSRAVSGLIYLMRTIGLKWDVMDASTAPDAAPFEPFAWSHLHD